VSSSARTSERWSSSSSPGTGDDGLRTGGPRDAAAGRRGPDELGVPDRRRLDRRAHPRALPGPVPAQHLVLVPWHQMYSLRVRAHRGVDHPDAPRDHRADQGHLGLPYWDPRAAGKHRTAPFKDSLPPAFRATNLPTASPTCCFRGSPTEPPQEGRPTPIRPRRHQPRRSPAPRGHLAAPAALNQRFFSYPPYALPGIVRGQRCTVGAQPCCHRGERSARSWCRRVARGPAATVNCPLPVDSAIATTVASP
jgi:hypothetical protein